MQNIFIDVLPPWVETGLQPAFYDLESGTVLQQTARMYAKVNEIATGYSTFTTNVTNEINQFEQDTNDEIERFEQATNDEIERFEGVVNDTVEEYIKKFNDLHDYVEDYFDNLDVQKEINNKLDEMAEDGTLQEIMASYLNTKAVFGFDNVADMKVSANMIAGSYARTLGYYNINDGGGATYKIRSVTNDDRIDEAFIIEIGDAQDALVAELVIEDSKVNIRQLGARSQDSADNKYDIAPYITKYTDKLNEVADRFTLYIPSGVWYSSPLVLHRSLGFSIVGDEQFIDKWNGGTIISSIADDQPFIFMIGNGTQFINNFVLKNICFSSADFAYTVNNGKKYFEISSVKTITQYCVKMTGCVFGDTDNLFFQHIKGEAFEIAVSWENQFRKLFFREIDNHSGSIMKFGSRIPSLSPYGGVNASKFDYMMFEGTLGNLIEVGDDCELVNNQFGTINFEDTKHNDWEGVTYTTFTEDNISAFEQSNPVHYAIFYVPSNNDTNFQSNIIENIQLNNFSSWYSTIDSQNYAYDNIVRLNGDCKVISIIINNIDSLGLKKNATIFYSRGTVNDLSKFILNNLNNASGNSALYDFVYDVLNFPYIQNNSRIKCVKKSLVTRIISPAIAAYEAVMPRYGHGGRLVSDSDCRNELGIAVKLTYSASVSFYNNSNKFYMRAKMPSGTSTYIRFSGDNDQTETIVGTGDYKLYEFTLTAPIGTAKHLSLGTSSPNEDCLIDYIIN